MPQPPLAMEENLSRHARLLVLPDRLAPLLHEETTVTVTCAQIRDAITEAFAELASRPAIALDSDGAGATSTGDPQGADDPGTAADLDDQ
jgi:hypothetical protein